MRQIANSEVAVDCGAHTGYFSLLGAAVNKNTKIVSFEPLQAAYERLRLNIRINSLTETISPFQLALGATRGQSEFSVPVHADGLLPTGAGASREHQPSNVAIETREVELDCLESVLQSMQLQNESVKLMKIDVEGGELDVLKGMENILKTAKPDLIIELLGSLASRVVPDYLKAFGYEWATVVEGKMALETTSVPNGNVLFSTRIPSLLSLFRGS
jgi:FkbM family methyltransferase